MKTERLELVETANIARSLQRLASSAGGYDPGRAKRALYHAICMTYAIPDWDMRKNIREALKLP